MANTMYKAAIIGCGKIGSDFADDPRIRDIYTHAGAYTSCPDTTLVAVCDRDGEKAQRCRNRWNAPHSFTDFEEMLIETNPDIVSVCTPDETHFSIIRKILESSEVKAVFAEKPLAMKTDDAQLLADLAKEREIILEVNYFRRFAKKIKDVRTLIRAGYLGKIHAVNGYYTKGTCHNGTHWFDLARFLIGEIRSVSGYDSLRENTEDPTYDALVTFKEGALGTLHACDATKYSIFEMDILGTEGRVFLKDGGHRIELYKVKDNPFYSGYSSLLLQETIDDAVKDALLYGIEDIVECIRTSRIPLCSGIDGVEALKIACAIRKSAISGTPVELKQVSQ